MSAGPLVSCVMPTCNRRRFVGQSIWYFLRQDYDNRELIVLDDGDDAVGDLVPDDDRIRYVRLEQHLPIGAKRNLACELARGELIAHWDDDDWIGPRRLTRQLEALLAAGADACGVQALLHYRLETGEAWMYRYEPPRADALAGCTLVYRRQAWAQRPFASLDVGEDTAFVRDVPEGRLHAMPALEDYIALIHADNTGPKHLDAACWQRRPLSEVSDRLGLDRDFYVALRDGRTHRRRTPRPADVPTVTVAASFVVYDGYGSMSEYLALGLERAGVTVNAQPLDLDLAGATPELRELLARSQPRSDAPIVYFCWPRPDLDRFEGRRELFINTMWESSRLPRAWVPRLNRARAVIVPTRFVADVCRASGVEVPVEVIPEGVDPSVYHYQERPERESLTTLMVGTMIERKNAAVAVGAWKQAFAGDPTARLIVKARFAYGNWTPNDPRITLVDSNETTRGIAHWYGRADVLLALGSEGFGLPLVEGMATGLPVIALDAEGQADVCADAGEERLLPVPASSWRAYSEPVHGACGVHAVPDPAAVAARLRWVAAHRDEARALGRAAAEWVPRHRDVWAKAPAVLAVLEASVERPLARRPTLWVPSYGTPCGIAEAAVALAAAAPGTAITRTQPDLRGTRILHVQHEPSLYEDTALTAALQAARQADVPTVVTEHAVSDRMAAWERLADVLVTTTARGAATLRGRLPNARIEHIPIGCATWFPPRKPARGRMIGAFGFLGPHKGFGALLEVLRGVPGTELLLFAHATDPAREREWERAAAGLPVRRVREYLPLPVIAARLAAEADVLAFWYDPQPFAAASAAVNVGLASGVPVLTSRTGWFAEVAEATWQPDDLAAGIERLLDDDSLRERLVAAAREHCERNSWAAVARRHRALWRTLENA